MFYTYIVFHAEKKEYQIGVTTNLAHRKKILCGQDPQCRIVYYEEYESSEEATQRENVLLDLPKSLLKELIDENNPMRVNLV
jgi:predicted GIY-YIG superfamily endonuclease